MRPGTRPTLAALHYRPLHLDQDAGERGDETRGVGPMWSIRQLRKGGLRKASTLGWPVRGWVQPPRWCLNGNTDEEGVDRLGEDADRPFLHGFTERLRPFAAWETQRDPLHIGGKNGR